MGSTRLVVVAACAVALAAAGCSAGTPAAPERPKMVDHPKAEVPKDRDARPALRRLDYCGLLAAAGATGLDARPGPFACDGKLGHERVSIRVTELDSATRLRTPARDLGGAKAYVPDAPAGCTVHLPVSFTLALTLSAIDTPCPRLEPAATKVVTTLADPAGARTEPYWDACGALSATLDSLDDRGEVDNAYDRALQACHQGDDVQLSLFHDFADRPWRPTGTVAGTPATVDEVDSGCWVSWRRSPATVPHTPGLVPMATVVAGDCARAKETAGAAIGVLRSPPPAGDARQPVFYAPTEPDAPFPGACAYTRIGPQSTCEPAINLAVPAGWPEILATSETDPNMDCAVATEAVGARFGPRASPVTMVFNGLGSCYFLTPERLVELEVDVRPESVTSIAPMVRDGTRVTIAGHPGYQLPDAQSGERAIQVGLTGDPDDEGTLFVRLRVGQVRPERGLSQADLAKLTPLIADVLNAHAS